MPATSQSRQGSSACRAGLPLIPHALGSATFSPSLKTIVHAVWNCIESRALHKGRSTRVSRYCRGCDALSMERTRGGGFTPSF